MKKEILELLNKNKKILDQYYDGYKEEDFADLAFDLNALFAKRIVGVTCCEEIKEGFSLGTTCPKCKRPFRILKTAQH